MKVISGFIIFLLTSPAYPCSFDAECSLGAKCIKSGYGTSGVCVESHSYGREKPKDSGSTYEYKSPSSKKGESCSYKAECGIGGDCLKINGSSTGTCSN